MSQRLAQAEHDIRELQGLCRRLLARNTALEDRFDKLVRHGKVTDVDPAKQRLRMEIGLKDGASLKSAWVPYAQVAGPDGADGNSGEFKFHNPPTVGQQMTLLSPAGDFRQAIALPFTWYDKAVSPGTTTDEHVLTFGKLKISYKKDRYFISLGNSSIEMTADNITLKSTRIDENPDP